MQKNKKSFIVRFFLLPAVYYLLSTVLLNGCATAPLRTGLGNIPAYNIGGTTYLPLVSLCQQGDINWDYDTFTRSVTLKKGLHRINLRVGEDMIIVDGKIHNLSSPVDMYQGTVVVPLKFKERYLDVLFGEIKPGYAKGSRAPICLRKVVIDAGHGGNDPGAIGRTGLREKDVNLDIAKRLAKLLRDQGVTVVMTRSTDKFIPLSRRVDIANNSNAELFISIHSNANRVRGLNGFEVYYVSPNTGDDRRALAAARNARLNLDRNYFASDSMNLRATLWDMIYACGRAESITLARSICRSIDREMQTRVLGVKGANFYVLKGVRSPAVLIEIGFVSNPNEERLLKNSYYRQQVTEAIAAGIANYSQDYAAMEASQ
ncbi:MAG: N-acetylmuramoyl-L-alanine amidase [Candidatus Omnitrophica bacterium]|nr:N-acetylmuramoyl-L-alanine amidase [Candidatus Omnitrophota bacterium]